MIKVLRDNTKETYYTKCKNCSSELEYEYSDVTTIDIYLSYHTDKRILCPVCSRDTMAELTTKDDYKDSMFSFKQTNQLSSSLNCCVPSLNLSNE